MGEPGVGIDARFGFLIRSRNIFFLAGVCVFLQGVFEKNTSLMWFFCGEFVVIDVTILVLRSTILTVENFPLF